MLVLAAFVSHADNPCITTPTTNFLECFDGTLSPGYVFAPTNLTVMVGQEIPQPIVSGLSINNGIYWYYYSNVCYPTMDGWVTNSIDYSLGNPSFDPTFPQALSTPGVYNYTGAVVATESPCDGPVTFPFGVVTVNVVSNNPGAFPLIDVDFGEGTVSPKSGFAAIGDYTSDFWNEYGQVNTNYGSLANLLTVGRQITSVGMTVSDLPTYGTNGSPDPMYNDFLFNSANGYITITNLPNGLYNLYLYSDDSYFSVSELFRDDALAIYYGTKTCYDQPLSSPLEWQQGVQYVVFSNIIGGAESIVNIGVGPGQGGKALISGMQIALNDNNNQTSIPQIFSFNPASGFPGTNVTIVGTNFSAIASADIVYFGAVQATVISASPTNLVVAEPLGATFAPITVTVNGLTAYADQPFLPTFPGNGSSIESTNFSRLDLPVGSGPGRVVIADLDGDGKPDLIVADSYGGDISIYQNLSTNGVLTANSFGPRIVLPMIQGQYGNPVTVAVADLDGDGRPDIIAINSDSSLVSIYRNISSPGTITTNSFAPRIDLRAPGSMNEVAVADLNGDDKPEIVTVEASTVGSVAIFQNESTPGNIAFASYIQLPGDSGLRSLAIGDLDGDGHPDLVTGSYGGTVAVYRNLGVSGNITTSSFAARVDLATLPQVNNIALGDMDGDGKLDIVAGEGNTANAVSVFRNTSTPGSLTTNSFAAPVNFSLGGWGDGVALGDLNGDGKPDVAADTQLANWLSLFQNKSSPGSFTTSSLGSRVDLSSGSNPNGVSIGDLNGDGRPEIVLANSYSGTISIYQNSTPASLFITTQPQSQTVCAESTVSFSVTATGNGLTYQWYLNTNGVITDGGEYSGSQTATLTLTGVNTWDDGAYTVVVTDSSGHQVTSQPAVLTVNPPTVIQTQPQSQGIAAGDTATFTTSAIGADLTYQWYFNGEPLSDGGTISGSQTPTLMLSNLQANEAGSYYVVVSGSCSTATSLTATLTVLGKGFTILFTFAYDAGEEDPINSSGAYPLCQPVIAGTNLLATTSYGGSKGDGLVFNIQKSGVIPQPGQGYFRGDNFIGSNGSNPQGSLVLVGSTIYGTTYSGGSSGHGTIYKFNTNATGFAVLYNFTNGTDGGNPACGLTLSGSTLYGTTSEGGSSGDGTIFSISTSGTGFKTLYAFTGGEDGANPYGGLVVSGNILYGTAEYAGSVGNGTVFEITTNGTGFTVLSSFAGGVGKNPTSTLVLSGNTLYGTTLNGPQDGNVFEVNTDGSGFAVLHSFSGSDGNSPNGGLILLDNVLYGTTTSGGNAGYGTVYHVRTDGSGFSVDYNFTGGIDGAMPVFGLAFDGALLYGLAERGGANHTGTIYSLAPAFPPIITAQPQGQAVCAGTSATFSVAASGTGLSYQWSFNGSPLSDGVDITGSQTATLTLYGVEPSQAGYYSVAITNTTGSTTSQAAGLTVNVPPVITTQPQSQLVVPENNVTLTVSASGTGLAYQWYFNGSTLTDGGNISGSQTATLTLDDVLQPQAGTYYVVVSGGCGSTTSTNAILTMDAQGLWTYTGSLNTYLQNQAAVLMTNGEAFIAGGTRDGNWPLGSELYNETTGQWSSSGDLPDSRDGATMTVLTNGQVLIAGGYDGYENFAGSGEIYDPASGQWSATGPMVIPRFDATATLLTNGEVLVAGGFSSGFAYLPNCELYNPVTKQWSATGSMTQHRVGHTATLLTNGEVLVTGGNIGTALSSCDLYNPVTGLWSSTTPMQYARTFHTATLLTDGQVLVAGGGGQSSSTLSTAETYDPVAATWTQTGPMTEGFSGQTATLLPNGQVLIAGGTTSSGSSSSSADLYYPNTGTWLATASMNQVRDQFTATLLPNGQVLAVAGLGDQGDTITTELYTSTSAQGNSPVITTQPQGEDACSGSTVSFSVAASGTQLTYQWYFNGSALSDGGDISGSLTPTLTLAAASSADAGNYAVIVTDPNGVIASQNATLSVGSSPVITTQPQSQSVSAGSGVTFTVAASGSNLTYQWFLNDSPVSDTGNISGSHTATLAIGNVQSSNAGIYTVLVINSSCSTMSSAASLSVSGYSPMVIQLLQPVNATPVP